MEQYVIKGGSRLTGEVLVSGAKNAALAILAAAIMADEPVTIENVPDVREQELFLMRLKKSEQSLNELINTHIRLTAVQFTQQQLIMNISRRLERLIIC